MDDIRTKLFDDLSANLGVVEVKYDASQDIPRTPDLKIVDDNQRNEKKDGNDQTGDKSGQLASLNDRFRQSDPKTPNSEIQGEWIFSKDITKLGETVEANIARKVREFSGFTDRPDHDKGNFKHGKLKIVWEIRVYEDDNMQAAATTPEDPDNSYRVMLVVLSDER